ncbi:MAG: ATP-binding cassette domain-containing protein [Cytophagales bacterium]|nr:MAG: ATP-binding cassette domain-containing protein [Cytophagales bacterium]
MKIYFKLLQYAKPLEKFAIPYFIFSILSTLFGLMNFTLLIPLLNILFKQEDNVPNALVKTAPDFSFSTDYFQKLFYYQSNIMVENYGKMGALYFVCSVIIISVFLANLFTYLSSRVMENLRVHTLLNLRRTVFNKVMSLDMAYFSNQRKGNIMNIINGDVGVIQGSITGTLLVFFKDPITLIGYFSVLFFYSAKLTLFTILVIPLSGFIISKIVKKLRASASEAQVSLGTMLSQLDETLSGLRIVKAFNAVNYTQDKFHNENIRYTKIIKSMARRQELASPVSEFFGVSTVAFIVLYGGSLVLSNSSELTASSFVAYIIIFSQVLRPAKSITNSFGVIQSGLASGQRVLELLDTPVGITENPNALEIKTIKKGITFENVTFSYNEKVVLDNVSFSIPSGQTIALVGPSGGGKSTISDLIPRFYDPQGGAIKIDGIDIKDYKINDLRNLLGIVNQEAILFNDTIFNNIAFSKPDATEEEVIQAAKVANAHDFIIASENGYNTYIGDRGVKLSGGQKQRLSIARAVLKNPPIMLLDEATSALDTESEKLVQDALNKLMKNRTSLVIAHRLSTIQDADCIVVINEGKVVEIGTHQELLKNENGLYHKLSNMQFLNNKI